MTPPAIRASGLAKRFKQTVALRDVDLTVEAGTVQGLLGRNGAGKTTLLRILTTLLPPDDGWAEVAGFDVAAEPERVRARIGVTGQSATMDELLSGRHNLLVVGGLFHLSRGAAARRADELLDHFGLTEAAERLVRTYSGGMRRRLDLAASLIASPAVLFLDEPTTGLDPVSREQVWDAIRALVSGSGTSVLLTTQYLEEADRLVDHVTVIDGGQVVASGIPSDLKRAAGTPRVRVVVRGPATAGPEVGRLLGVEVGAGERSLAVPAPRGLDSLADAVARLRPLEDLVEDVALAHPSLEEVFASLTGGPAPPAPLAPAGAGAEGRS